MHSKKGRYTTLYSFFCNSCIPEYAYTILYTVISNEIFFQWPFVAKCIPNPVFTALNTASSLFCSQIPITYQLFWHIPNYTIWKNKILSWLMWIVILIENLIYHQCIQLLYITYKIKYANYLILYYIRYVFTL